MKIKAPLRNTVFWAGAVAAVFAACRDDALIEPAWFYITSEESELPSNTVYGVYAAADGTWFATELGLAFNRGTEWEVYSYWQGLPAMEVFAAVVVPGGDVWVATPGGAARLRDGNIKSFTTGNGLPSDRVYDVAYDGAKVWFATEGGLARFNDPGFTVFRGTSGLPGDDVRDVYAVGVDRVWAACIGGAAFYDRGRITAYTPAATGLPSANVYAVAARGEEAWIGTDRGLCLLRGGELVKTYTSGNSALEGDVINALGYRAGGELWVATAGAGVSRSVGNGFETFDDGRGLLSNYVLSVHGDKLGYVWLGTLGGGVNRFYD